jgi:hypothetical protein
MIKMNTRGLSRLAQTTALPAQNAPVRLPTYPSVERTAVLKMQAAYNMTITDNSSGYVIVMSDPVYPIWASQTTTNYSSWLSRTSALTFPTVAGGTADLTKYMTNTAGWSVGTKFNTTTGYYFQTYTLIDDSGRLWWWVPANSNGFCAATTSATVHGGAFKFNVRKAACPSELETASVIRVDATVATSAASQITAILVGGGWFTLESIECTTSATATTLVSVNSILIGNTTEATDPLVVTTAPTGTLYAVLWPFLTTPFEGTVASKIYKGLRVNSLSVLFQNTTAVMEKEGTVQAVRLPYASCPWDSSPGTNFYTYFADAPVAERYVGLLEKGLYTYVAPDESSVKFHDYSHPSLVNETWATAEDPCQYYHFIKFTDQGTGSKATQLMLTLTVHYEFRSSSMLWEVGVSKITLEEWHQAQVAMMQLGFFFENPAHLATIARLAGVAARAAWPTVKRALGAAAGAAVTSVVNSAKQAITMKNRPQVTFQSQKPDRRQPPRARPKAKKAKTRKQK